MNKTADRATVILAVLATAAALYLAADMLVPLALALLLVSLLWPVVQLLARWKIPPTAGAAICILGVVGLLGGAIASLGPPARSFANEIPKSIEAARPKVAALSASIGRLTGTRTAPAKPAAPKSSGAKRESVKSDSTKSDSTKSDSTKLLAASTDSTKLDSTRRDTTAASGNGARSQKSSSRDSSATRSDSSNARKPAAAPAPAQTPGISAPGPTSITHALGIAGSLLSDFIEIMLLAMFILAAGSAWNRKLGESVETPSKQQTIVDTVTEMRSVVSHYVLLTALINVAQGAVVGLSLKFLGYSSPLLWGVLTFALEFIPYLGGMVIVALLTVVGLAAGRDFPAVFAGPAAYLVVTTLQNNVLSPIVYGKRMQLNPTAILLGLMLMYMLWGVAGAFMAVPILAAFNVLASRIPVLKPLNVFLSD